MFLPKFGAGLIKSIPTLLAEGLKDTLSSVFMRQKMTELGEKGNQAKAERALIIQQISNNDPIKAFLLPWVQNGIEHSTDIPKYLRGTISEKAGQIIAETPLNLTEQVVPRVIDFLDSRIPQLKLSERLKELDQLQKVEKVE